MNTREFLMGMGAGTLGLCSSLLAASPMAEPAIIRWAELEVDTTQLVGFRQAAIALKEAVFRAEPGVAVYHAAEEVDNPGHVHVLEMYDDARAYQAHVEQPHFQEFRAATAASVTARRLHDVLPLKLGAKAQLGASPLVRIAELRIVPALLPDYTAAVTEEIETSIQVEPGVQSIHAVALKDDPTRLRFFEIYADEAAYRQHIESPHFRKYVSTTTSMILERRLLNARVLFVGQRSS